ncbi:hypothetical protein OS189_17155 [Sulfitobacter sp. F26169L]|uniref:metallophosphoesterase n=1 Tax=Sulfitobacter sp. F26169L TaxID=2996015 RepID=UPI002260F7B5|nr:metallophosphoesterase [Sulfitobacter sp. F26169L]MCX7568073.1 hypothetical protein [Sulfitobacter sp. F26169L]
MEILVPADLHFDEILDNDVLSGSGEAIKQVGQAADTLIIAGDLSEHAATKWPRAIRWLGALYPKSKTVIFPGDHDYYGDNLTLLDKELDVVCCELGCSFRQCRRLVL